GNRFVGNNFAGLQCHWRTSDNAGGERVIAAHNVIINRNEQAGSAGFWMSGFKTYTLANNYIRHNDRGILVSNGDAAAPANNISVTGNVIEDTTRRGREGIYVSASSISRPDQGTADMEDVTVGNNAMRNTGGLRIEAGEQNVKNVSAVGNTIRDSMGHGIEVTNEQGGEVIGATLQSNSIDNPAGSGITLLANGAAVKHLSIADNSIANASERGIVFLSSSGGTTKDVVVEGNTVNTTNQFAGIQIGLPANEDTAVVGNTVRNAEFSGMNISGTHGTVVGNVLVANGKHGVTIGDPNHIIKGNLCKANEDSGISMNASETIVVGNRCLDNGTYGITRSSGIDHNVITNNIVRGNSSSGIGGSAGSNSVVTNNIT
ncbi:MAG: right-handed parallel beta-helix repeat-containing protein, partial [Halovenus sp.]